MVLGGFNFLLEHDAAISIQVTVDICHWKKISPGHAHPVRWDQL